MDYQISAGDITDLALSVFICLPLSLSVSLSVHLFGWNGSFAFHNPLFCLLIVIHVYFSPLFSIILSPAYILGEFTVDMLVSVFFN